MSETKSKPLERAKAIRKSPATGGVIQQVKTTSKHPKTVQRKGSAILIVGQNEKAEGRKHSYFFSDFICKVSLLNPTGRIALIRSGVDATLLLGASEYYDISRHSLGKILGMSPATTDRKIKSNATLGAVESERLTRLAVLEAEAEDVFGNKEKAREWMSQPNMSLGGTPMSILDTDVGGNEVRKVLNAIAYGGAA